MFSILKNLFVLLGLILIAGLGYYIYTTNGSPTLEGEETNLSLQAESADLVRKLDSIKRINIDRGIFSDPRFTSLRSFASPVPTYPVGRDNPFEPSGGSQ